MRFIGLGLFLASASLQVTAQVGPFPPPPTDPTKPYPMSSYLEEKFGDQMSNCLSDPNKRSLTLTSSGFLGHKKNYTITAIPSPLLTDANVRIKTNVLPEITDAAGRVFAYVYPTQTVRTTPDDYVYLDLDYLQDPASMLPAGTSSTLYNYSCSSNIAWQMKANAGAQFPVADVSTAMQADTSNTSSSQLAFIFGKFNSPLWDMYNNPKNLDWKTYADLLMWGWYTGHPSAISDGTTRYLLTQFTGATAYKLSSLKENVDGTLSVSGGFTIPVASLQTGLQAAYNNSTSVTASLFSLVIDVDDSGNEVDGFIALPSATQVINDVAPLTSTVSTKLDTTHSSSRLLQAGSVQVQVLNGVPADFCQPGRWTLSSVPNGTLTFDTPAASPIAGSPASLTPPGCSFRIKYTPSVAPAPTDSIALTYKLVSSVAASQLVISAAPVYLSANGKPTIDPTTDHGVYTKTSSTVGGLTFDTFSYSLAFPVENDPADPVLSVSTPLTVAFACGSGNTARSFPAVPAKAIYDPGATIITLTFSQTNDDSLTTLDSTDDQCHLSGNVMLTLQDGTTLPKNLPDTLLYYPKVIVPPVPAVLVSAPGGQLAPGQPAAAPQPAGQPGVKSTLPHPVVPPPTPN